MLSRVLSSVWLAAWAGILTAQTAPARAPCAACHAEIAENYARTGMGRAFFKPLAANTVEDYTSSTPHYNALSDTYYAMSIRNGQYLQRRWQPRRRRQPN